MSMPLRPTSVGHVNLKSARPKDAPAILCNYLSTEKDRQDVRDSVRTARYIFAQKVFDVCRGPEIEPGPSCQTDGALDAYARRQAKPTHHLCGTCKMGIDDEAVVDESLKVHGIERLRVVDASVMPRIPSGNINAPAIMLAEKAADLITGVEPLAPLYHPYYRASVDRD